MKYFVQVHTGFSQVGDMTMPKLFLQIPWLPSNNLQAKLFCMDFLFVTCWDFWNVTEIKNITKETNCQACVKQKREGIAPSVSYSEEATEPRCPPPQRCEGPLNTVQFEISV